MRIWAGAALLGSLAGCAAPSAPALVSAQTPPGTGHVNSASEPQPANSMPPGAPTSTAAPGASQPNYATMTFRAF